MTSRTGDVSVDEAPGVTWESEQTSEGPEVATWERGLSVLLGVVLVLLGVRRGSLGGLVRALLGGVLLYRGITGRSRVYRELGVRTASERGPADQPASQTELDVEDSITIDEPAEELSERWRDPEQLSRIFGDRIDVTEASEGRLRWELHGPVDRSVSWETQVVEERPGEIVRWKSVDGSSVRNEGEIRFGPAPAGQGTEVTLQIRFEPPGGEFGTAAMERLNAIPRALVRRTLRRFKSLAETGEVPTISQNPSGRGRGDLV